VHAIGDRANRVIPRARPGIARAPNRVA